ncbi:MAG: phosphatidate cytidylyltransferase, partial [Bacteroidales bacterium]
MGNFFRRTLTAVWIVVFILGGFWLHPLTFFITGLVITGGALYEYYTLLRNSGSHPQLISGLVAGLLLYIISTLVAAGILSSEYFLILIPVAAAIMFIELYRKLEKPFDSLAHTFFAVIYIALPFSLLPFAAFSREGIGSLLPHGQIVFSPGIIIGFLLLLWANDTGAYLIGVAFGKKRLMERISPKKSWEGFFGGAVIAALVAWLLSGWLGVVSTPGWVIIALIITVTGT